VLQVLTGHLDAGCLWSTRSRRRRAAACGIGSKGPRVYDWALIDSADPDHQYLIRRSIDDGELAFYHCYNPNRAGFGKLVGVAGARWPIEECFGSAKNEVGLDNYQVPHLGPGTDLSDTLHLRTEKCILRQARIQAGQDLAEAHRARLRDRHRVG